MNFYQGKYEAKILVISNNPFSEIKNNGKTLASFFDTYQVENIAQIYFSIEKPDSRRYLKYYQISDIDVMKTFFNRMTKCGSVIPYSFFKSEIQQKNCNDKCVMGHKLLNLIKKSNFFRIVRELIWKKAQWKTNELDQWIKTFSPDIVFFCAGDSGFAYDITEYICNEYNTKLVVYITDDYILARNTCNLFWWCRRNYILAKMKKIVKRSDLFLTISNQMKETYKKIFNKDSIVVMNMTESLLDKSVSSNNNEIRLIYAGGLHYKRCETLALLIKAIIKSNENNVRQAFLKIYSNTIPDKSLISQLTFEGASEFCGALNLDELKKEYNKSDILVHVESFNTKSIESTRLSISTKISEYLSLGKPILAIGPANIASMEYLKDIAYCITDKRLIEGSFITFIFNESLKNDLAQKAIVKYNNCHFKSVVALNLRKRMNDLIISFL